MTTPVGGLRARLIRDSLYSTIYSSLAALGWFDVGRQHAPVTFHVEPIDPLVEVVPNAVGIAVGNDRTVDQELGSVFAERDWMFFVDVFAENDTVGLHLARDIKDFLEGRMPSIARPSNVLPVYDFTQATPPVIFSCLLEDVIVDKAQMTIHPWQRFWYAVSVTVKDWYRDENG